VRRNTAYSLAVILTAHLDRTGRERVPKDGQCVPFSTDIERDNPDTAMCSFHFALLRGPTRKMLELTRYGKDVPKLGRNNLCEICLPTRFYQSPQTIWFRCAGLNLITLTLRSAEDFQQPEEIVVD